MRALAPIGLIAATIAFDLFVLWGVGFTLAWSDGVPPLSALGFWLFAASPLVVTIYCVVKVRSICRGERPRI